MNIQYFLLYVLPVILMFGQASSQSEQGTIQVRLVNGSSRYEGTVQYSEDETKWNTICGVNLDINTVKVICRQLGFNGANRNIRNSPFSSSSNDRPTTSFNCAGNEANLGECTDSGCPSSDSKPGAAVCYDERYLGCFIDDGAALPGNPLTSDELTIESCIEFCKRSPIYVYAGVGQRDRCYCGESSADYDRYGKVEDDGCQTPCIGDQHSSCGGNGKTAIFNLSVVLPPSTVGTTIPSTTTLMRTDLDRVTKTKTDSTSLASDYTTEMLSASLMLGHSQRIALYTGVGVGGAFLVILIVVMVIAFITCKRRKSKKDPLSYGQPMVSTSAKHETNNDPEVLYFDIPDAKDCSQGAAIPHPSNLYATPDLTAKSSSKTTPVETSKKNDLSLLYAVPCKGNTRKTADGHGVGIHKSRGELGIQYVATDNDVDKTVMIENEIYNS